MSDFVKTVHRWVKLVTNLPPKDRFHWFMQVVKGIRSQRKGEARRWLSEVLIDETEFHRVGFAANLSYVMMEGDETELPALFVHAMGSPAILLAHKRLPLVVIASASLRYDKRKGFTG